MSAVRAVVHELAFGVFITALFAGLAAAVGMVAGVPAARLVAGAAGTTAVAAWVVGWLTAPRARRECPSCGGVGVDLVFSDGDTCPACRGTGLRTEEAR